MVALAVGSAKRSSVLPDLPTTEEAGFKGSAYDFWVGLLAPAGTPPAVIERLNTEVRESARLRPRSRSGWRRSAPIGADHAGRFDKLDRARAQ